MLSASGVNAARMSSLQVTVFEGLVGDKTITCRDAGTTMGGQSVNISILSESFYRTNYYSIRFQ